VRVDKELIRKAVAGSDPARFYQVLPTPCPPLPETGLSERSRACRCCQLGGQARRTCDPSATCARQSDSASGRSARTTLMFAFSARHLSMSSIPDTSMPQDHAPLSHRAFGVSLGTLAQVTALGSRVGYEYPPGVAITGTCSVCGAVHEGIPLEWGFERPWYWDEERDAAQGLLTRDLCVIASSQDDPDYFVRGVIEIRILDGVDDDEQSFGIGAWVSLSKQNFKWYVDHPEGDEDDQGDPWFGWLSNSVRVYPETLSLKTNVLLRGEEWRPSIQLQPTEHPLALDQQNGITIAQARELSARWVHS
jgi:hypothetical protein